MKRTVYFWWSASEIMKVTFVRWQRKLNPYTYLWDNRKKCKYKIRQEKGWWGVGAVVRSSWAWDYPEGWRMSRREKLPRHYTWLAPHTKLFLTERGCQNGRGRTLRHPTMKKYKRLMQRRCQTSPS